MIGEDRPVFVRGDREAECQAIGLERDVIVPDCRPVAPRRRRPGYRIAASPFETIWPARHSARGRNAALFRSTTST